MLRINDGPEIKYTFFSDNTSQIWHISMSFSGLNHVTVYWEFFHEMEIMHLAQLKDLLDAYHIEANLHIKYLPYARADKPVSNMTTFGLHTFARILNAMNFNEIIILDPHSDMAVKLIQNAISIYPTNEVWHAAQSTKAQLYIFPDEGAKRKYRSIYGDCPSLSAQKKREQSTGKIIEYTFEHKIPEDKKSSVLIIDDLCDGGATFVLLAKKLKDQNVENINLFVTHGIFSNGLRELKNAGIKRIFTADGEVLGNNRDSLSVVPWKEEGPDA